MTKKEKQIKEEGKKVKYINRRRFYPHIILWSFYNKRLSAYY